MSPFRAILRATLLVIFTSFAICVRSDAVQGAGSENAIPFKAERSVVATSSPRVLIVTAFALTLAVIVILLVNRRMRSKGVLSQARAHRIKIVEVRRVTTRTTVAILAIDNREYLLAQNGDAVQLIEHHHSIISQGSHESQA